MPTNTTLKLVRVAMPKPKSQTVALQVAARTHVGRVRKHNEDSFLLLDLANGQREPSAIRGLRPAGLVLGVCDGMGGAAAGEVASRIAVEAIAECMTRAPVSSSAAVFAATLVHAVEQAGEAIRDNVRLHPSRKGMGTTCTAVAVRGDTLYVAQVGDSRAYLFRCGALVQVTKDQSLLTHLLEVGQLTQHEAENFAGANVILQAVGTTENLAVALTSVRLQQGDRLLVCSDGLHGLVPDDVIASALLGRGVEGVEAACERLIELANIAGGKDNITVVVAAFDGPGLPHRSPAAPPACTPYLLPDQAKRLVAEAACAADAKDDDSVRLPPESSRRHFAAGVLVLLFLSLLGVLSGILRHGTRTSPSAAMAAHAPPRRTARTQTEKRLSFPVPSATPRAAEAPNALVSAVSAEPVKPGEVPKRVTVRAPRKAPATRDVAVPTSGAPVDERKWAETGEPFESPFQ